MKVKRILSLVLSLMIMLGAVTVSAFAENENINVTEIIGESVLETDADASTVRDEADLIDADTIDEVPVTEEISIPEITEEENKEEEKEERDELISALLENIAKTYTDKSSYWEVMDMGAYKKYAPETEAVLSDAAVRAFITTSIKAVSESDKDADLAKAILALTAQGKDATRLYKVNSNTPVDAVKKMSNTEHSTSVWSAPYTLAAYNRNEYKNRDKELSLVNALLASQGENGAWDEYGTIDTTANAIAGLSFYLNDEDSALKASVNEAIEAALTYLSVQQNEDGSFSDSWSGRNSNSTAMVAIALAAAGVDVEEDTRFIKNGNSIIDGLLSFALEDNSGFGHTDNITVSDYSTEQAFRALIALAGAIKTNAPYNVYDFNGITLSPARATDEYTGGNTPSAPQGNQISVSLTVKADNGNWLSSYNVTLPGDGATIYHAFVKGCNENNLKYEGADKGYVSSISKGNKTLAEFGAGKNSGWLYKLNGEAPLLGIRECSIKNGDRIEFFYTKDYTKEHGIGGLSGFGNEEKEEEKTKEEEKEPATQPLEISFADVPDGAWYKSAVEFAVENKLFNGVSEKEFAPSASMTRAMLVTVLHRMADAEADVKNHSFEDVPEGQWYSDAVAWATANGIATGMSEVRFAPDAGITREQMAAILYRYASLKGYVKQNEFELSEFADSDNISTWAYDALCWANAEQLINGRENGYLAPKEGATRAEVAAILMRFCEKYIK